MCVDRFVDTTTDSVRALGFRGDMGRLFVAEKPSVAEAIAEALGVTQRFAGYLLCGEDAVTWCYGHMLELADPDAYTPEDVPRLRTGRKIWRREDLPIVPEKWKLIPKGRVKKQLAQVGRLLKSSTMVVHAGDPDREGQLLVDEVLAHFDYVQPVLRYWASAQDPASVRRALADLRDNRDYTGLAEAARGRQRADWLLGMNLSREFTLRARRAGGNAVLSVGRVQTPTLAMVVARDVQVEAYCPQHSYSVEAELQHAEGHFLAQWCQLEGESGRIQQVADFTSADCVVKGVEGQVGRVSRCSRTPCITPVPLPLTLCSLTVEASRLYGYNAQEVLDAAQALYAVHKLSTYPRTESAYLPEHQHADAPRVLAALCKVNGTWSAIVGRANPSLRSAAWNDSKVEAHHGIVPTVHEGKYGALSERERHVYGLIVQHYLMQFFAAHTYAKVAVMVEFEGVALSATGTVHTCEGFRAVLAAMQGGAGARVTSALPEMAVGDTVRCKTARRKEQQTRSPKRFTEGTLVQAMQQLHQWSLEAGERKLLREGDTLGTSATRAAIIGELKRRGYLQTQGRSIVSTPLGRDVVRRLPASVKSPVLTALFERMLSEVESGKCSMDAFVAKQVAFVRSVIGVADGDDGPWGVKNVKGGVGREKGGKCDKVG